MSCLSILYYHTQFLPCLQGQAEHRRVNVVTCPDTEGLQIGRTGKVPDHLSPHASLNMRELLIIMSRAQRGTGQPGQPTRPRRGTPRCRPGAWGAYTALAPWGVERRRTAAGR